MASSSSVGDSSSAVVLPKASLSSVPSLFSQSLALYLSLHTVTFFHLEAQIHLSSSGT
jgi:hypothetical protein